MFNSITNIKSYGLTEVDIKDLVMDFKDTLNLDRDMPTPVSSRSVKNGILQIIQMGLLAVGDLEKDTKLADWNAERSQVYQKFYVITDRKKVEYRMPMQQAIQAFASPQQKSAFMRNQLDRCYATYKYYFFTAKMQLLTRKKMKVIDDTKTDGSTKEIDIAFDNTIKVGANAFTDNDTTLAALGKIKYEVESLMTPSDQHTKLARDKKSDVSHDNMVQTFAPGDLFVIWNTKYRYKIDELTASLFNKFDALLKIPTQQSYRLDLIKGTAAEKKAIEKTVCYIVHKSALFRLNPDGAEDLIMHSFLSPNLDYNLKLYALLGYGRIEGFPIIEVKAVASS